MRRAAVLALVLAPALVVGALLLRPGPGPVGARQASPTPVYSQGITAELLSVGEPDAAPGYALRLVRLTFEPGAFILPHTHPGPSVFTVISGVHSYELLDGRAWVTRGAAGGFASGTPIPSEEIAPGSEVTLEAGDALFQEADAVHAAGNPGTEPLILWEAQLREVGQPLTTFHEMAMGTPTP